MPLGSLLRPPVGISFYGYIHSQKLYTLQRLAAGLGFDSRELDMHILVAC